MSKSSKILSFSITSKVHGIHWVTIDSIDRNLVLLYTWHLKKIGNIYYVMTRISSKTAKRGTTRSLHQLILGTKKGMLIDHKNGDGLDNRRCNLRLCDKTKNSWNRGISKNNTSGYKGIYLNKKNNKWISRIKINGRVKNLGTFHNKQDAAIAYNKTALIHHGEFARLNKI